MLKTRTVIQSIVHSKQPVISKPAASTPVHVLLYGHSSTPHSTFGFENDLRFSSARRACEASIVLSGKAVSENSRSSYSWRVSELGKINNAFDSAAGLQFCVGLHK